MCRLLQSFLISYHPLWRGEWSNSLLIGAKIQERHLQYGDVQVQDSAVEGRWGLLIQPRRFYLGSNRAAGKRFRLSVLSLLSGPPDKDIRLNIRDKREGVWRINKQQLGAGRRAPCRHDRITTPRGVSAEHLKDIPLWKLRRKLLDRASHHISR